MRMHLYISTVHSIDVCTYTVRKKKRKSETNKHTTHNGTKEDHICINTISL